MTLPPTLTLHYWFTPTPAPFAPVFGWIIFGTFAVLTVVGIAAYIWRARKGADVLTQKLLSKCGSVALTTGLIGLTLYAFEYERVQMLTMRVLYLALGAWFVWSVWRLIQYIQRDVPEMRQREQEYHAFTKWLPKKKKK